MKKGVPAKFLFIPGLIAFLIILFTFGPQFLPNEGEYKKDQAHLTQVMTGRIPDKPDLEVKLPVRGYHIPAAPGSCMIDAAAGIVNFLEADIDFDQFTLLSNPTLFLAGRTKNERYGVGGSFTQVFMNLGYTPLRGTTTPIHPPQSVDMGIEPKNQIYFKTKEEVFALAKKLLTAKIVPIVTFYQDPFEPIEGGLFSSLVGYDQNGVWVNVAPPSDMYAPGKHLMDLPTRYEPRYLTNDKFLNYWTPDHQIIWFIKTGNRVSDEEIYTFNKRSAQEAPANIQKNIEFLKANGDLVNFSSIGGGQPSMVLYRYFQKRNYPVLANEYLEIAKTYEDLRQSQSNATVKSSENDRQNYIETLEAVYPYYSRVANIWP